MFNWLKRWMAGSKNTGAGTQPLISPPDPVTSPGDLDALIARCGLSPARALILSHATPCFHMIAGASAAGAPLGTTRLGGAPDLAVGSAWPAGPDGWCGFLGQFDLADVRARTGALDLPPEGLLSLFVDFIDSAADPVPVRAVLTPPGVTLARLSPPAEGDYGSYVNRLNPISISAFTPGFTLPVSDGHLCERISALAPDGDIDAFTDVVMAEPSGAVGQLLGQGFDYDGSDLRAAIHAQLIGRPGLERFDFITGWDEWERLKQNKVRLNNGTIYCPWQDSDDDQVRYFLDNRAAIKAGIDGLRLLVLIKSNKAMNLWINDADPIFLFIPASNLASGDFFELHGAVTQG